MTIHQYETAKIIFYTDENISESTSVYITFQQGYEPVLELSKDRITFEDTDLYVTLTQEETGKFTPGKVYAQLRYLLNGESCVQDIININVMPTLKSEVIE